MCKDLVRLTTQDVSKAIPITDSKLISQYAEIEHRSVRQMIKKHENDFKEFGTLSTFKMHKVIGRPEIVYTLNEQQATLLMTYLKNTKPVREFKKKLVKAFFIQKNELQVRSNTRHIVKDDRINFTKCIKQNVVCDGNFKKFAYSTYTKLVYKKIINTTVKKYKEKHNLKKSDNIRDFLSVDQLIKIQELESKIATYLEMTKLNDKNDKEIYQEVKKYVDSLK